MNQDTINQEQREVNKELFKHAEVANKEMGMIQADLGIVKTHIGYMKEDLASIKPQISGLETTVQKWIGGLAVITFILTIISKFL